MLSILAIPIYIPTNNVGGFPLLHIFFIFSLISGCLHCIHVQAIINSAAKNIGLQVTFLIMVFSRYMPRSGIAGPCDHYWGFPSDSSIEPTYQFRKYKRHWSGSGKSPGGDRGNPLQYSCLENPMDRGVW